MSDPYLQARLITKENFDESIDEWNSQRPTADHVSATGRLVRSYIGGYLVRRGGDKSIFLSENTFNDLYETVKGGLPDDGFSIIKRTPMSFLQFAKNNPDEGEK